jgi:hypothetical protein
MKAIATTIAIAGQQQRSQPDEQQQHRDAVHGDVRLLEGAFLAVLVHGLGPSRLGVGPLLLK